MIKILDGAGVSFVVIGGIAATLLGSPSVTHDLDICYERGERNIRHLVSVLEELGARLRGAPADVPFILDERTIRAGDHLTLTTKLGDLDILGSPAGSGGFASLAANAERFDLDGLVVKVASLEDLMSMKRASGRPKDLGELEILGALREEIEQLSDEEPPPSH